MQPHSRTAAAVAQPWLAVAAVAACDLLNIVTTEMLPVGLLTPIGQDFAASAGNVGLLLAYGIADIAGNFLVGLVAPRNVSAAVVAIAARLLVTLILFLYIGDAPLREACSSCCGVWPMAVYRLH